MKEHLRDIVRCVRCGRCRTVCPAQKVLGWESSGARGRMQMALGLATHLEPTEGMVRSLLNCTTCQHCVRACPAGADPLRVTQAARHRLISLGRAAPHQKEMLGRITGTGNSLGDESPRMSWLLRDAEPKQGEFVYFAGCLASYREKKTAYATSMILRRFSVCQLEDERCCGSPLYRLGMDASDSIEHNVSQIKKTGAHTVLVGCAGCYSMFREKYPGLNVLHISEFLADRLDSMPIKKLDLSVTYHDPCHLAGIHGITTPPRTIIQRICTLVEMKDSGDRAHCCGGGGGVRLGYPELSGSIARNLAEKIPEDIDYVVTSCPLCSRNLSDAGKALLDLADLIWMSMGEV